MYLSILVFICGAAVMALEIISSRFFAPYIGTSVLVWTSLIGIVMAGLSCGYLLGGVYGDRWKSLTRLRQIVGGAGLWVLLIIVLRDPLLSFLEHTLHSVMLIAVTGTTFLLLVPSILLGMVTPYAVRLSAESLDTIGHTAGRLSALSTLGSIAGTFLAGFAFIPHMSTTAILFGIATALVLTAALGSKPQSIHSALAFVLSGGIFLQMHTAERALAWQRTGTVLSTDTPYSSIQVQQLTDVRSGKEFHLLRIDGGAHGAKYTHDDNEMVFAYTKYYRLADLWRPNPQKALLIGGGSYTVAQDFLTRHSNAEITVLEIDPTVTKIAKEYFGLHDDNRMQIHHEDARTFFNRGGAQNTTQELGTYHMVFGDAFRSESTVPFHLATKEAVEKVAALLDDNGVYLLNVIGSLDGEKSEYPKAQLATLKSVFPFVMTLDVHNELEPQSMRNIMFIASKTPLSTAASDRGNAELLAMMSRRLDDESWGQDGLVLTDNFAPVESMLHL